MGSNARMSLNANRGHCDLMTDIAIITLATSPEPGWYVCMYRHFNSTLLNLYIYIKNQVDGFSLVN